MKEDSGIIYALASFLIWGLLPLYWKLLDAIPAHEILAQRIVWSFLFIAMIVTVQGRWRQCLEIFSGRGELLFLMIGSVLITGNWLLYIWSVTNNFMVEASLGYFMTPLFNVFLGAIVLKERLRPYQLLAIALVALAVIARTFQYGKPPWISLILALSFGTYALVHKKSTIAVMPALCIETAIMVVPAEIFLVTAGRIVGPDSWTTTLLFLSGIATAVPLLLYVEASRRLTFATLSVLQYLAPTCQFLLAILWFGEPFMLVELWYYGCIWITVIIYSVEGIHVARQRVRMNELERG